MFPDKLIIFPSWLSYKKSARFHTNSSVYHIFAIQILFHINCFPFSVKFFTLSICISSFFSTNPSRFHTISSLFRFFSIQILSCLQPISRNGLNQHCSIQTISHGSPPFVGGPSAVEKQFFFFSTHSNNKKSVNLGTLQIFNFCHQTPCENLFCFSSSYYLASWIRSERGNLPFLWWNPVSPPYSMYVRLQPNFPKWFESALPNLDQFTWISTIRAGDPLR